MKNRQIIESIIENREEYNLQIDKYCQDPIIQKEIIAEIHKIMLFAETICNKLHNSWFLTRSKFEKEFSTKYSFNDEILSIIYNDAMTATK
ncbi:MAG: hypothetical protein IPM95_09335 [Sphingobacteriales bacterium]|nr:hypothetical protein [Sphingobacteriales bacterium]